MVRVPPIALINLRNVLRYMSVWCLKFEDGCLLDAQLLG